MSHFITSACIGCTQCTKNCPVDAIEGRLKELHIINTKRCVDCGVCGKVCPKSAVIDQGKNPVEKVAKGFWMKPFINTNECSACSICVDICKFRCLEISYPVFKGDLHVFANLKKPNSCVGCGMCEDACPLTAIIMKELGVNE